jgi:hypothetical protein
VNSFIEQFWIYLKSSFGWLLDGLQLAIKAIFYIVLDGLLTMIQTFMAALNIGNLGIDFLSWWGSVPPQVIWILHAINLGQCITMLVGSIGIRVALNLIPSWATRV